MKKILVPCDFSAPWRRFVSLLTHGRKGIAHLMSASIAEDVANHISIPTWTLKIK